MTGAKPARFFFYHRVARDPNDTEEECQPQAQRIANWAGSSGVRPEQRADIPALVPEFGGAVTPGETFHQMAIQVLDRQAIPNTDAPCIGPPSRRARSTPDASEGGR